MSQRIANVPQVGLDAHADLSEKIRALGVAITTGEQMDVIRAMMAVQSSFERWTPVESPLFPLYISSRRDLIDAIDASMGLLGGFLRNLYRYEPTERHDLVTGIHARFERLADSIAKDPQYAAILDALEEDRS